MRDESVGLYCVEETFRSNVVPSVQSLLFWKMVKSVVDLDGVEMLGVVLKPFAFRQTGRIEYLLPVVVVPAGSAYAKITGSLAHSRHSNILKVSRKLLYFLRCCANERCDMVSGPQQIGRWLIAAGIFIVFLGVLMVLLGRIGLFKLPGDIEVGSKNWRIYIPIVSCIFISIILTLVLWLINYLRR